MNPFERIATMKLTFRAVGNYFSLLIAMMPVSSFMGHAYKSASELVCGYKFCTALCNLQIK